MPGNRFVSAAHFRGPFLSHGGRVSVVVNGAHRFDHDFDSIVDAGDVAAIIRQKLGLAERELMGLGESILHAVTVARAAFNSTLGARDD